MSHPKEARVHPVFYARLTLAVVGLVDGTAVELEIASGIDQTLADLVSRWSDLPMVADDPAAGS